MMLDLYPILVAVVMGVVEGLTEFLPVSSTGHLIVVGDLLGQQGVDAASFEIFIQLGAVLAVVWHYRERLWAVAARVTTPDGKAFVLPLFVAFLPAAIVGLLLHDWITAVLFRPLVVAAAMVVGGIAILIIERLHPEETVTDGTRVPVRLAFGIGLAQLFALIPGTSRSATTILGGYLLGLSRMAATEFSFLLAIPVLGAATLYELAKGVRAGTMHVDLSLLVGTVTAFLVALLVIRGFLRFVSRHDFRPFAWYRIVFGLLLAGYYLWR